MIDAMFQEGTNQALDDQLQRPAPFKPDPAPFKFGQLLAAPFQGASSGSTKSAAFGAEIAGAFGETLASTNAFGGGGMFRPLTDEERKQGNEAYSRVQKGEVFSNPAGDELRAAAKAMMPDPQTTHAATQVVAGIAEFGAQAVTYSALAGPAAPLLLGGDVGMAEADKLKQQGVDVATRTKAGAVAGAVAGASIALPVAVPGSVAKTATAVVAGGPGGFIAQNAAEKAILEHGGYKDIASTYDPLDPVGLALSTLVPAGFGAVAVRGARAAPKASDPRGVRNNNPGNIEAGATQWQGQTGSDGRFATFVTPEAGIRALGVNLLTYQEKHGLNTIEGIVNRWAPPGENNTGAYVNAVAKEVGVGPKDQINLRDAATLEKLTGAIVRHENGKQPYSAAQIREGIDLALTGRSLSRDARAAVAADPDTVAAARVRQTLNAIESYKLTPASDLAGATAHADAMEVAHAQLARGEAVNVTDLLNLEPVRTGRLLDDMIATGEEARASLLPDAGRLADPGQIRQLRAELDQLRAARPDDSAAAVKARAKELQASDQLSYKRATTAAEKEVRQALETHDAQIQRLTGMLEQNARAQQAAEQIGRIDTELNQLRAQRGEVDAPASSPRQLALAVSDLFRPRLPEAPRLLEPVQAPGAARGGRNSDMGNPMSAATRENTGAAATDSGAKPAARPGAEPSAEPGAAGLDTGTAAALEANPDLMVQLEGMDKPMRAAEVLDQVKKEAADDVNDAPLLDVAANCFLRHL